MNLANDGYESRGTVQLHAYAGAPPAPSLEMIVQSISDLVEVIDPQGVITYSNMPFSYQGMLGLDRVLGKGCSRAHGAACVSCADHPLKEVIKTGRSMTLECPVQMGDGKTGWVCQRLYPVWDHQGQVAGVLRMVFDITRQKAEQAKEGQYLHSLERAIYQRGADDEFSITQDLSAREREVLSYLADGMTNQQIARLLGISRHTVKSHVVHIFNKLGVNDRTQAAVAACRLKLI